MSTPNLAIPHIAASQNQKEVTANDAFDRLDDAICGLTAISLTGQASPLVLASTTALRCAVLQLNPAHPGGGFEVVVPTNRKPYTVRNLSGGAITLRTAAGAGVAVADGRVRLLYADGTDVVDLSPAAVGGVEALDDLADVDTATAPPGSGDGLRWSGTAWVPAARGLDVGVFVPDRPTAGALVFKLVVVRAFTLPAGLTGSRGHASAAATAQADFDLRMNGSSIGSASFAAGSVTASFALASATSLAEGDRLELAAPSPQDATLADLTILLKGSLA
ncbi:MAG: hypothetical protein AB7I59_02240 [Geminicoccaceae bacterium]